MLEEKGFLNMADLSSTRYRDRYPYQKGSGEFPRDKAFLAIYFSSENLTRHSNNDVNAYGVICIKE